MPKNCGKINCLQLFHGPQQSWYIYDKFKSSLEAAPIPCCEKGGGGRSQWLYFDTWIHRICQLHYSLHRNPAAGSSEMIVSEVRCRNYPYVDKEKETEKNYSNLCKWIASIFPPSAKWKLNVTRSDLSLLSAANCSKCAALSALMRQSPSNASLIRGVWPCWSALHSIFWGKRSNKSLILGGPGGVLSWKSYDQESSSPLCFHYDSFCFTLSNILLDIYFLLSFKKAQFLYHLMAYFQS